ncbi:phosphatase PAP2 family protein [Marilutibacter aestuarii]|nr:phosphatase PAP2 family protein [Lysobacter aestuarii]
MTPETRMAQAFPEHVRLDPAVNARPLVARAAPAWAPNADFLRRHALWPLLGFAVLATLAMAGQGDAWIADRLYAWEGHRWVLRDAWATEHLIHRGGRDFSALAWLMVLAGWAVACLRPGAASLRRPLAYLLVATLASTLTVALLKNATAMDCPWDLARYGGHLPAVGLFELRPAGMPATACFPAGHASAGYAWVASYFFLRVVQPRMRHWGLAFGLGLGLVFGVAQQLRGAHFVSHDVWTAAICWFVALGAYLLSWPSAATTRGALR